MPVELIVHGAASVWETFAPGRLIVPFKIPVPVPRRNKTEDTELNPPAPAVIEPFTVSVLAAAGTNCTIAVPAAVIGPSTEATPVLVTCVRRLTKPAVARQVQ